MYPLYRHRGRRVGASYTNGVLMPLLRGKAGVPPEDARGRITGHRARATIATRLRNAEGPMSPFELQEPLGHLSPEATRRDDELRAVDEGIAAHDELVAKLVEVPAPDGATPRQALQGAGDVRTVRAHKVEDGQAFS